MTTLTNQQIFDEAKKYLLDFSGITEKILDEQLAFPEYRKPKNKNQLCKKMIEHAKNRDRMDKVIGDIDRMKKSLHDFNAEAILNDYQCWEKIFDTLKIDNIIPKNVTRDTTKDYKGNDRKPRNLWVSFCKSIISITEFVKRFNTIDDFYYYIDQFITNTPDTRISLPLILAEEIDGYGFALACDFIKEGISPLFVKPDRHIIDIFKGINKSDDNATNFQVFRDVVEFADSTKQTPYLIDKLFWLIGSGDFYLEKPRINIKTDKHKFIEMINSK